MNGGEAECCEVFEVHQEQVNKILKDMPSEEQITELANLFKVFGDVSRMKILYTLFEGEVCVCDLAELLGMTQSAVSHQLKVLKQAKLVAARREGKSIFYSLADDHVRLIIAQGMEHVTE